MKKTCLLFSLAATMLAGCTKNTTTNNITTPLPAFTVDGIHDVSMTNSSVAEADLELTIQYSDSSQEAVSLSLSSLPAGITIDPAWITNGIPTYSTELYFYDTTTNGATPGTYPMTLTATGATTGAKTYLFNIKIFAAIPCTTYVVGKYNDCNNDCGGTLYSDSVYADPTVVNKIWFTNFDNTGNKVYGLYSCSTENIVIPSQTVGGVTYSGNGDGFGSSTSHTITIEVSNGTTSCELNMN
jgi:hypothetical protein